MHEHADDHLPLSALLSDIRDYEGDRISVGELSHRFGGRALGALLLIFSIVCMLPLPPGGTTIFGLPLVLLAPQLVIGNRCPWLPGAFERRTVAMAGLRSGLPRAIRWVQRVEALSRPRLTFLFGPAGERLVGLACTALALVLILPIPGGNILPAAASSVLAMALMLRDGALALIGFALVVASFSVLVALAHLLIAMLESVWTLLGLA